MSIASGDIQDRRLSYTSQSEKCCIVFHTSFGQ